jgi:hypothetical protein
MRILKLIIILALLSGCKHPTNKPLELDVGGQAPTKLASRIADTDNVVVTNYLAGIDKKYRDATFVMKGATMGEVVTAVSSGGRLPAQAGIDPLWVLQFYKGTNYLDSAPIQGSIFVYEGEQYGDGSGVLERLEHDLLKCTGARFIEK